MSSLLVADLALTYDNKTTSLKSVNLKTFVLDKKYSIIRIGNISNDKTKSTRKDIWMFCLNNKTMLEHLIYLEFDKLMHEHLAIKYFYAMLDENKIRFNFSNNVSALFTLSECAMSSHPGARKITLYDWMMTNIK